MAMNGWVLLFILTNLLYICRQFVVFFVQIFHANKWMGMLLFMIIIIRAYAHLWLIYGNFVNLYIVYSLLLVA